MWAKDQGRVEDDFGKDELDPRMRVSVREDTNARGECEADGQTTYASFAPRNCFVNSHVNSIKIR